MSSLYSSPVTPSWTSSDYLVSHRMKECCVQLHASIQKWKQLTEEGFNVATKLVNTLQHEKYTRHTGGLSNMCDVSVLEPKIIEEREGFYTNFKDVLNTLESVVARMGILSTNVRAAVELLSSSQDPSQPIFQTLSPVMFGSHFEVVYKAYCQEISLREKILGDILQQSCRDTVTMYLSCWLHEPHIGAECIESLEALLIDTNLSMDPELAKKLFHEGATLFIIDVPQGTEFGIDYNSWTVGPNFKGVKMIPPGFHFVFYRNRQKGSKSTSSKSQHDQTRKLVVRRWDKSLEVISSEGILPEYEDRLRRSLMDLDSSLGAYPYESLKKWVSLSNYVTEEIVSTVRPHNGYVSSVTQVRSDDVHSEKLQKELTQESSSSEQLFAGVGHFTAESVNSTDRQSMPQCKDTLHAEPDSVLRFHLVSTKYPKDSTPAQVSHHCMDFSFTLEEMLTRCFTSEDELLGELQLAFLCFLQGQVYDAFEHWKSLIQLLCSCEEAMKCRPKFFSSLISVLHFQLKEIPADFFVDIVSRKNFLTTTLQIFFSILEDSNGSMDASLVKKGLKFRDNLNQQFKWDFSVESEEYAPTVVD